MKDIWRSYSHHLVNLEAAREMLDSGATTGHAEVLVGVYDVPDDHPAMGNSARQVIDKGAFKPFVEKIGPDGVRPFFLDHAEFQKGWSSSLLQIGVGRSFRDSEDGLYFSAHYNLKTGAGHDAFENLVFEPSVWQYSFRNYLSDEQHARGGDGFDHVTAFADVKEVSMVPWGAQGRTGALAGTIAARVQSDPEFRRELLSILREEPDPTAGGTQFTITVPNGSVSTGTNTSNVVADPRPALITSASIPTKVFSPENEKALVDELRASPEAREIAKKAIEESERQPVVAEFLDALLAGQRQV